MSMAVGSALSTSVLLVSYTVLDLKQPVVTQGWSVPAPHSLSVLDIDRDTTDPLYVGVKTVSVSVNNYTALGRFSWHVGWIHY